MVMRLRIALLILLAGLAAMFARPANAQTTLNLADCSQSSLQTEWNAMSSGAYVLVFPSCAAGGTGNWTTQLNLSAPPSGVTSVTLQGNTVLNCTGTAGTSSYACTATDTTVISDSYEAGCCTNQLLILAVNGAQFLRITGITFQGGTVGSSGNDKDPAIQIGGSSDNVRIDHCHFNTTTYDIGDDGSWIRAYNPEGLVDHSLFDMGNDGVYDEGVTVYNDITNTGAGDSVGYADGSWGAPSGWGTAAFWFIEDNVFNGGFSNDCAGGGRFVERYNTLNDMTNGVQDHSTKSQASPYGYRGCREEEVYKNYGTGPSGNGLALVGMKGATGLIWGNTLASGYGHLYNGQTDRNTANEMETNPPGGWGYCGTSIASNGVGSGWDGNSSTSIGYPCLDGVGRGQSTQALNGAQFPGKKNAVNGCAPVTPVTCNAWPQQYLEPVYLWMNTVSAGDEGYLSDNGATEWERDVYPDCGNTGSNCSGSFNGTEGTGYGLLSARPSTCTAGPGGTFGQSPTGSYGVGYFATDTNTFYVCYATNSWIAIYTPYTYPHPLQSGGGGGGGGSVTFSPGNQNFGSVNVGSTSSNVTFTVDNGSSTGMTSVSVAITGTNASYFTNAGTGTCSSTLASMASCTIVVNFTPGAAGSGFSASVQVSYSGGDGNGSVSSGLSGSGVSSCSSPVTVNVYTICSSAFNNIGSGTSISVSMTPYAGNGVEVFAVGCGTSTCGSAATQTYTISDNVNSPETCFTQAPHSPYQSSNSFVPDYPYIGVWYCPSMPAGVTTITVTASATMYGLGLSAQEIKAGQIASTGYFESVDQVQNSGNIANTTASISTSGATANAADLNTALIANCGASISAVVGTGYTGITVNPSSDPGWVLEDMGVASTGTQTATTTWSSGSAPSPCPLTASAPNDTWWGVIVPLKGASSTPTLNPPVISPVSGTYASPTVVTITGPSGSTVCYTTNGAAPSASTPGTCDAGSTAYSGSFNLTIPSGGATVEALATETGYTNSSVTSVAYSLATCANTSLAGGWDCVTSAGNSTGTSGTSLSLGALPVNPPAGALIVVTGFNGSSAGCAPPSDSLVNTWHLIVSPTVSADSLQLCAYWAVTTSAGADTVTWNSATTAASMGGAATVYTTPSGTLSVDKTCSNSNATSSAGSNNVACSSGYTNSGSNELNVFASYGDYSATVTAGANYTLVNAPALLRDQYYMQASASAITPAQTLASGLNYGAMGASFDIAAGSAPPLPPMPPTALIATPF